MSEFILEVDGMTCINCEQLVEDELASIRSIDGVTANATKGCVRVEGSPSAVSAVQEAIDDIGFDVEQ